MLNPEDNFVEPTAEEQQENLRFYLADLIEKLGISRDTLYNRMKFLQITTYKDSSNRAYLKSDQVSEMEGLHQHIQTTGRMDGYKVPPPSGPGTLSNVTHNELSQSSSSTESKETIREAVESESSERKYNDDIEAVVNSAQRRATGILIAEKILANQYISNPDLLNPDLKQQIAEAAPIPKIDPFALAASLVRGASM